MTWCSRLPLWRPHASRSAFVRGEAEASSSHTPTRPDDSSPSRAVHTEQRYLSPTVVPASASKPEKGNGCEGEVLTVVL
jgi:hypothetical protein